MGAFRAGGTMSLVVRCFAPVLAAAVMLAGVPGRGEDTERASVGSAGNEGNENSFYAAISANGRHVGIVSTATNFFADDTNAESDVFIHDRKTDETECISLDPTGDEGDGQSSFPALSATGRYVAFESGAPDLVPDDENAEDDVFVRDRQTVATERVSVGPGGVEGDGRSHEAAISARGRFVAFQSSATNLVTGDANVEVDVFVHDRKTGETERVSLSSAGSEATGGSENPQISGSGRYVAFESGATDLVTDDANAEVDVFVHDRKTGETARVSVGPAGAEGNGESRYASISGNGRFVAFSSSASNLVPDDENGVRDIFVHDRKKGETTRVSLATDGTEGDQGSSSPMISANGRVVAFESDAENLVTDDANAMGDVFTHDRKRGVTERVSVDGAGVEAEGGSYLPAVSGSGRYIAFESDAENLVESDGNAATDVFVRDRK